MAKTPLASYLNDHLAGAVVAMELLEHLERAHLGESVGRFISELKADITADRHELEELMSQHNIPASLPRKAAAWLSEKGIQLKVRLADPGAGALYLLETLDALSVGIEGKRLLWRAISAASVPGLADSEYTRLQERAEEQRSRVEAIRLDAAKSALAIVS